MRRDIIFIYLSKFKGFKKDGSPIYFAYFLFRARLPRTLEDFERLMARARKEAERLMQYYGMKIGDVERFVVHRQGIGKGHTHTQIVNVFRSIGVDKNGRIVWMTAPSRSVNPEAYHIYNQYRIRKLYEKHGRDEALARLIGIQLDRPKIKLGQIKKFGNKIPSPHELVGSVKLGFQDHTESIPNLNNIIPQLPDPPHKIVERSIIHRKNMSLIDHEPFKF
jgi:hypothetical protein